MTLYEFIALDELEQAEAVWNGVHLGDRQEGECTVLLYQIDSFYVEVFYHPGSNRVTKFRPFKTLDLLQPYLEQINVLRLLNGWHFWITGDF